MCPCPVCATIAFLLLPFWGFKWAQRLRQKHHCHCAKCQEENLQEQCCCEECQRKNKRKGKK